MEIYFPWEPKKIIFTIKHENMKIRLKTFELCSISTDIVNPMNQTRKM